MSHFGESLPIYSVLPFIGMLLSISLFPLIAPRFWHRHFGKISLFWALVTAIPLLILFPTEAFHILLHVLLIEYIPFVILLGTLYVISGNIYIQGNFQGTPFSNTLILALGTALASLMGTTGASVVLIRPLLRANLKRRQKTHLIIFFIFLVSNIGGSLTPLGDPPLFLGYLKGVPFFWTLNLLFPMLLCSGVLLLIFYLYDSYLYSKEKPFLNGKEASNFFQIKGWYNIIFLLSVPLIILLSGKLELSSVGVFGIERPLQEWLRDLALITIALLSFLLTPQEVRDKNEFTLFPIKEVAILFFGIFISMVPALNILQAGERGALGFLIKNLKTPEQYFWTTGLLSAFLDNAPTYLTLLSSCLGSFYPNVGEREALIRLLQEKGDYLLAISCGAVFFGALTYIGNAPNFMIRSIAEEKGIPMPSFFGYLLKFSIPLLIPLFLLINLFFFRS
ncbi:MAG: sodium:proton antiporter [Caldimicrobium sp.]|nr:sodium:proton antiporter [Caldimicrobium sp.]MCX7874481.1 sodium:proton antiporter [Caldimicrobium sp.]MDW8094082.1 sodium:proton antiporter [Caldimicrobium sp.]